MGDQCNQKPLLISSLFKTLLLFFLTDRPFLQKSLDQKLEISLQLRFLNVFAICKLSDLCRTDQHEIMKIVYKTLKALSKNKKTFE